MSKNEDKQIVEAHDSVLTRIKAAENRSINLMGKVQLVAVSKTFSANHIEPVLKNGQKLFGENKVQEAQSKWPELKLNYPDSKLHLIGPLQTNKTKDAVALFDVIQTLDRPKLAKYLAKEMKKQNKWLDLFIQVNIGNEPQKAGVSVSDLPVFLQFCRDELELSVIGLMCIPPKDDDASVHFKALKELAAQSNLNNLSMGMSSDFETAIACGANYVRVGSAIFGIR